MISIEDLAEFAGTSVAKLQQLADRLPKATDFKVYVYATYNRGSREIIVPTGTLDSVTKNLHRSFSSEFPYAAPPHVHGFVKGRSTLTNAAQHLGQACVLRVDLQSFFPSIDAGRVASALRGQGLEDDAVELCTKVVTLRGRLPIGLSTSPLISNLVFQETDDNLVQYSDANSLTFTRYVDDMSFSGYLTDQNLLDIKTILDDNGWRINESKTAFMRRGGPQYVTGLYVGCADGPRIPRRIKRQMRRVCFLIEHFGYQDYMERFGGSEANMIPNRLYGWARYIASVEPRVGYSMMKTISENVPEDRPHSAEPLRPGTSIIPTLRLVNSLDDIK